MFWCFYRTSFLLHKQAKHASTKSVIIALLMKRTIVRNILCQTKSIKQIDIQMFNVPQFCNMFLASMQERGKTEEENVYRIEPCHG